MDVKEIAREISLAYLSGDPERLVVLAQVVGEEEYAKGMAYYESREQSWDDLM